MEHLRPTAWGHPDRHYTASAAEAARPGLYWPDGESGRWQRLLEDASPGMRKVVERTYKQWNNTIRDYLRGEMALRLSGGAQAQSVPVRVVDGVPPAIAYVLQQFEGIEWLLLNRPAVAAAESGTAFMEKWFATARQQWGDAAGPATEVEIRRVRETASNWLRKLNETSMIDRIVGVEEDVLGAYFFRIPEIRLYWIVIGITALAFGLSVDALTIVVLAHELAHAYTHLGRDTDNELWETELFAATDLDIVEGLAQFYTEVSCKRLASRVPNALLAYKALLDKQSAPYRAHLAWVGNGERSSEIIRASMIECRSKGITESLKFATAIKRYRAGLRG